LYTIFFQKESFDRLESNVILASVVWCGRVVSQFFEQSMAAKIAQLAALAFIGLLISFALEESSEKIERDVEAWIKDPGESSKIKERITQFRKKYPQESERCDNWLQTIHAIELSAKTWEFEKNYRTYAQIVLDEQNILQVPDDGNCAYHAASFLLNTRDNKVDHLQLRNQVHAWLVQNAEEEPVQGYLDEAYNTYNEDIKRAYDHSLATYGLLRQEKSLVEKDYEALAAKEKGELDARWLKSAQDYIARVATPGFWASLPELYAIGVLYQIQVKVENTAAGTINLHSDYFKENSPVTLVYNWRPGAQGSHYNGRIN
jgi:OTU-like cysteine protease